MAKAQEAWTPYGLESIRIAYLRRRRILALLILLLLLGTIYGFFTQTTTKSTQIFANGNDVTGQNTITIDQNTPSNPNNHVTVSIEPGRVTSATAGGSAGAASVQHANIPSFDRAPPINWGGYLLLYGPYVLVGLLAWYLAKRRGKNDEVNFGVYKGAMPLEMISATHAGEVFTRRHAKESIFGKRRHDHLPRDLASVEAATVEEG
jgi:hypothetical protein